MYQIVCESSGNVNGTIMRKNDNSVKDSIHEGKSMKSISVAIESNTDGRESNDMNVEVTLVKRKKKNKKRGKK